MATYTPCQGWKQPPRETYKPVNHRVLYNGRKHRDAGIGLCPSCLRVTSLLDDKQGRVYVGRHGAKRQSFDTAKRTRWEAYKRLGPRPPALNGFAPDPGRLVMGAGTYAQSITMIDNGAITNAGAFNERYVPLYNYPTREVRIELTSRMVNNRGQYVFNVNGQTYVGASERMILATDYAVWNQWSNSITVSNNTYNTVWNNWQDQYITPRYIANEVYPRVANEFIRAAQPARRPYYDEVARAEDLFRRVEADVERQARAEAALKARETLLGLLTEEQRQEYLERKHFHVRGSRGRLYRIKHGSSGNIRRVRSAADEGREEAAFCVHSQGNVRADVAADAGIVAGYLPHEDHMIQQMLHLMIDEDEILSKANVHWGSREPGPDYEVLDTGLLVPA